MRKISFARVVAALAVCTSAALTPALVGAIDSGRGGVGSAGGVGPPVAIDLNRGEARFEGRTIDLSKDWEGAEACHVADELVTTCYRTEDEMDQALGITDRMPVDVQRTGGPEGLRAYATCQYALRLYKNSYYGGQVLYITSRWQFVNLSWFGFDNAVSSYRVGGCASLFRSGSYGSGSTYPGPTYAWASAPYMYWGWDNVISSVYQY